MTSCMSCSTIRTVTPRSRIFAISFRHVRGLAHVQSGRRFIEEQHRRFAGKRARKLDQRAAGRRKGSWHRCRQDGRCRGTPWSPALAPGSPAPRCRVQGRFSMPAMKPALLRTCRPTMTFSSAVMCENSLICWNVRDIPSAGDLEGAPAVDRAAVVNDAARVGRQEAGDEVEERGLARAVRPDHGLDAALARP